ncbi:MAG TPA: zinc ABC transporter substrate-binding protein [Stellaceae bacterium]|nr:zinc ABC transporter substrate-binding protein [Stellaceae bacterium]
MRTLLALLLVGVAATAQADEPKLKVVASFSVLADLVRQVGGDDAEIASLVGPDGDAHVYQPTPADAQTIATARVVVVNGLGLDAWMDRLEHAAGFAGRSVVASEGIDPIVVGGAPDPHAWQDVVNAEAYARNIAGGLSAADPAHAAGYASRLQSLEARLADLDRWIRERIDAVPEDKRRVITSHDAFAYFGKAYGVTFRAPVGMSEDSEPSAAAVAALVRRIRTDGTKALFVENMTDPRLVRELADEAGVTPGGTLYADALSRPGDGGETYDAMMRHNATLLAEAMARN